MGNVNSTRITLNYDGPDVDNGSMPIDDILLALQGFSSAYAKIVKHKGLQEQHQLRLVGLEKGSCNLVIDAIEFARQGIEITEQLLPSIGVGGGVVITVVKLLLNLIKLTKHTEGKDYSVKVNGDNNEVTVNNFNNVTIQVPVEVLGMYKTKLVSSDLNKIAEPLSKGKIDSTKLLVKDPSDNIFEENISFDEKKYFDVENIEITTTKEIWLEGIINALTKSTNNGKFILTNGDHVPFHMCMERPQDYYHFFSFKGYVRVKCIAHLDESLKTTRLDIYDIQETQINLFN